MYDAGADSIVAVNQACTTDLMEAKEENCQEILVFKIIQLRQAKAQLGELSALIEECIAAQTQDFVQHRQ